MAKSTLYKQIDMLCVQSDTTIAKLAQKLGTTPQNLYTRLQRGKIRGNRSDCECTRILIRIQLPANTRKSLRN